MTEASLLTELRWDALAAMRGCLWVKVHDAVRKGLPDVHVSWAGFTSFVEAKYVRPGEDPLAVIKESPLQLATMYHACAQTGGRAFYAVWVQHEKYLETQIWVPRKAEPPHVGFTAYMARARRHIGAFENGLFTERLKAQHRTEWTL